MVASLRFHFEVAGLVPCGVRDDRPAELAETSRGVHQRCAVWALTTSGVSGARRPKGVRSATTSCGEVWMLDDAVNLTAPLFGGDLAVAVANAAQRWVGNVRRELCDRTHFWNRPHSNSSDASGTVPYIWRDHSYRRSRSAKPEVAAMIASIVEGWPAPCPALSTSTNSEPDHSCARCQAMSGGPLMSCCPTPWMNTATTRCVETGSGRGWVVGRRCRRLFGGDLEGCARWEGAFVVEPFDEA